MVCRQFCQLPHFPCGSFHMHQLIKMFNVASSFFSIVKILFSTIWFHSDIMTAYLWNNIFRCCVIFYWLSIFFSLLLDLLYKSVYGISNWCIDYTFFQWNFECMWDADSEKENEKLVILYFARDFFFFCSSQFCPLKKNNMFTLNGAENRLPFQNKCK